MERYNHMFTVAFEVVSNQEDGEDVTGAMLRKAILKRLDSIGDEELEHACGAPDDTYKEE